MNIKLLVLMVFAAFGMAAGAATLSAKKVSQSGCMHKPELSHLTMEDLNGTITLLNGKTFVSFSDLSANCAAELTLELNVKENHSLELIIRDISPYSANCNCFFDVEGEFDALEAGEYEMTIYRNFDGSGELFEICPSFPIVLKEEEPAMLYKTSSIEGLALGGSDILEMTGDHVLVVKAEGLIDLEIYDTKGLQVLSMGIDGPQEIYLGTLAAGLYLVRATDMEGRCHVLRFVM